MLVRIISSIVCLPILLILVIFGGLPLQIAVLAASLIGMHEFYQAFSPNNKRIHIIGYAFAIFYGIFLQEIVNGLNMFNIFVSVFLLVLLIYSVICHSKTNALESMTTFFGFFYVSFLLSHVVLIRQYTYGSFFIWLAFICAWGCDTGAYFTGMSIGKHKLIPSLSPKKTIEGAIGGVVAATLLSVLYGYVIQTNFTLPDVNIVPLCAVTGFIGSILSQIGDLAASAMKRYTGIKDFGKLIPGHGGIIDRFDSVLLTAPTVYYIMLLFIGMQR